MASASDIEQVRLNTNEPTADTYADNQISAWVDELGVAGTSAKIWTEKAARYSELVDVTEAGASHKFSDLNKTALAMAAYWDTVAVTELAVEPRARVHKIVRS